MCACFRLTKEMKRYSQNNEQEAILKACPEPTGRLLDLGCWNAEDKSNTRALIERGWTGVLVEPSPQPFAGIQAFYAGHPGIVCIQAAVGFDAGTLKMWMTPDATSTLDEATYKKWNGYVKYEGQIDVEVITLEQIFNQHGGFDMVSIDTEGSSVDLMHRMFELNHFPQCICVEHDGREGEILSKATKYSYACVYHSGENLVLVRR